MEQRCRLLLRLVEEEKEERQNQQQAMANTIQAQASKIQELEGNQAKLLV